MITISEIDVSFRESLGEDRMAQAAIGLEEEIETIARARYGDAYDEFLITVSVQIESGSTKTWIRILALLAFIERYGSIHDGAKAIIEDGRTVAAEIAAHVPKSLGLSRPARVQLRAGLPERIHEILERVAAGELSVEQATALVNRLIDKDIDETEEIVAAKLKETIANDVAKAASIAPSIKPVPSHEVTAPGELRKRERERKTPRRLPVPAEAPLPPRGRRPKPHGVIATRDRATGRLNVSRY